MLAHGDLDSKSLCQVSRHINPDFLKSNYVIKMRLLQCKNTALEHILLHVMVHKFVNKNDKYLVLLYFVL